MRKQRISKARGLSRAMSAIGVVVLAAMLGTGCFESSTDVGASAIQVDASEVTLNEVRSKVQMSDDQATQLSKALGDWQVAEQQLNRGEDRGGAAVSPILEFLASSASVLDRDQLLQLVAFLHERQEEQLRDPQRPFANMNPGEPAGRPGGPGGRGPSGRMGRQPGSERPGQGPHGPEMHPRGPGGRPGGGPGGILRELGLDEEQWTLVQAALQEAHEAGRALHEAFEAGYLSEEEFRAGQEEIRTQLDAALADVLTDEQYAQMQELKLERLITFLERLVERVGSSQEHRLELLTAILDLNEQQQQDVASIQANMVAELESLLEAVQGGSTAADDARQELRSIQSTAHDAVRALLSEEQAELFDALSDLARHKRPPRP